MENLLLSGAVRFRVRVALETGVSGSSVWDTALWEPGGDGIWSGVEPTWIDVTEFALSAATNRGRDRWGQRARAGNASVQFDNTSGLFNPISGEQLPGQLQLRPGRLLNVQMDAGLGFVDVWTGQIYSIDDQYRDAAFDITTKIDASDVFTRWSLNNPPALESPVPAERSDLRIGRILDLVTFPDEWRVLDVGLRDVQSSELPRNRLDEMQITSDSEGGIFFIAANGYATFRRGDYLETDPRSTDVQYRLGGPIDDQIMLGADSSWTLQQIINDVRLARSGGTEQRVENASSQSLYGQRTFRRSDYENVSDADVLVLATGILEANEWDRLRINEVTVYPQTQLAAQELLGTEIGDRLRVSVQTGQGWSFTQEVHVQRIRTSIRADDFSFIFRVDDAVISPPDDVTSFSDGYDEEAFF